jgi:hypothetical protein
MTRLLRSSNINYTHFFLPRQVFPLVSLLLLAIFTTGASALPIAASKISFVTPLGAGTKTGATWENASSDLQAMIDASASGDEVWVAGGTYNVPSANSSFILKEGVKVYGGFAGTELALANRNLALTANKSTLSAGFVKNAVVSNSSALTTATRLDGFTIGGSNLGGVYNTGSSSPMLVNLKITGNFGVGVSNQGSSPVLINCAITGNFGVGVSNQGSSPVLINCAIVDNGSTGMNNSASSPVIINSTIVVNIQHGVGIHNENQSSPRVRNSILYASDVGFKNESSSSIDIQYSLVYSQSGVFTNGYSGITYADPLFSNPASGDYTLQYCSPGLNSGSNTVYASGQTPDISNITTDLAGRPRFYNAGRVDMGAYEYQNEGHTGLPGVRYVKKGGTGNGSSWECAMGDVRIPLFLATSGEQIWIAGGSYDGPNGGPFTPREGVKMYGGFAGTEASLADRDLSITANKSILRRSGSAGNDNSVVTLTGTSVLDGFTITDGIFGVSTSGGSPVLANLVITGVSNAGIANQGGTPVLINCAIINNVSTSFFLGVGNTNSSPLLINCTIAGNSTPSGTAVGMYNTGTSAPRLRNSIIYGNLNGIISQSGATGTTTIEYSIVESNNSVNPNPVNDTNPLFVNAAGGDYRLQPCSPAINAGSNAYFATGQTPDVSGITKDLAGNNRFFGGGVVDMGAFEYQGNPPVPVPGIWHVKVGGTGSGVSWDCPMGDLQLAINNATSGEQVWVAGGTFQPTVNFAMKEGVKIYGGFAGTEASLAARNLTIVGNKSILQANGRTVLINSGLTLTTAAVLDGFTIRGSTDAPGIQNYPGSSPMLSNLVITEHTAYGGMSIYSSSPTLMNCSFTGNYSSTGGGLFIFDGSPKLISCSFTGNSGDYGAGIYIFNSSPTLVNCLIKGNTATGGGGGMCVSGSTTSITNCTIVGNTTAGQGGGILNRGTSPLFLRNSIVYGNNTGLANLSPPQIFSQYSLVQGIDTPPPSDHNIAGNTDPLFVDAAADNYRLQPCSPLVNAGFNYFKSGLVPDLSGISSDLDANPRMRESALDMGAYEFGGAARELALDGNVATANVSGDLLLTTNGSNCRVLAYLSPNGGAALTGAVSAKVWVAGTQPVDYVKRHYQINPVTNALNATAKVTLYFTQQEFTDFNVVSPVKLPLNAADLEDYKANLRIEKRSGISNTDFGLPSSYTGAIETITPSAANGKVEWNADAGRWEVSFDVTGFSGFFVKTIQTALPLNLISFTATHEAGSNLLQWSTTSEINTDYFDVQSSRDAKNFIKIAAVEAAGSGDFQYRYNDRTNNSGTVYYRLKMSDLDKTFTYSRIISIAGNENFAGIYPNPAGAMVTFQVSDAMLKTTANLYDMSGRRIQSVILTTNIQQINTKSLASGLYILKFADGTVERFVKE